VPPFDTSSAADSDTTKARICETRPSPTDNFVKTSAASPSGSRADHDPPENIHRQDHEPGYGVAAHEFRRTIHRTKKLALLF
jgi:hypothetical protein